jgi:MFS family permease
MTTSTRALLSHHDLRTYLLARFAGTVGVLVLSVAVGWQVYALTNDPVSLGWVGAAQFFPMLALTLPAGDLADRYDRRLLTAGAGLLQALAAVVLAALTLLPEPSVTTIYAALVLFGVGRAIAAPSSRALVPLLVSGPELPQAIALSSSTFQAGVILGPAIGGALYLLGPAFAYATSAALLLVMSLSFYALRTRPTPAAPDLSTAWSRVSAGLRFLGQTPLVLGAVSLDLFAVLLGGATALLPVYAKDVLHVGAFGLGVLRAAPAVGALLVNVAIVRSPPQRHIGRWMFGGVALFGLATLVFGASTTPALSLAALVVMGGADMLSVWVRSTLIPLATPPAMLGRVSAVEMLFIGASNELGELESGLTAGWFGPVRAVLLGGAGTLLVAGTWMGLFPSLRDVDRLDEVRPG